MFAATWLCACALFALAGARVYERCELAHDLRQLGVERGNIATWVCIAYHESRFDTSVRNLHSGDHGLLQISELYWCGAGKACGLPCSALRDDDIADDVECALRIHEEHTRLQGDGFLAWVVYPQHCKHNTKKYLVDCDSQLKNITVMKTVEKARAFNTYDYDTNSTFEYNNKIDELKPPKLPHQDKYNIRVDELKPPYLAISSFIRGSENEFEQNYRKSGRTNWSNYKVNNIDELKLPILISTTTTTTTTTTAAPATTLAPLPIAPRRLIETNQFRNMFILNNSKISPKQSPVNIYKVATFTTRLAGFSTTHKPLTTTTSTTSRPSTTTSKTFSHSLVNNLPRFVFTTRFPNGSLSTTKSPTFKKNLQTTMSRSWTTQRASITTKQYEQRETTPSTRNAKTTESIFDLYLNTRRAKLPSYRIAPSIDSRFKLKIFSDGTTTPLPPVKSTFGSKAPVGGAARNHFRRQTSYSTRFGVPKLPDWPLSHKTKPIYQPISSYRVQSIMERDAFLVLTYPHFLYADPTYRDGVIGMNPDIEKHRLSIELEPLTATIVRGSKRAQFNTFMRPVSSITATQNLKTTLTPMFWIEESMDLTEEYIEELKTKLLSQLRLIEILIPVVISVCCIVLLIGVIVIVRAKLNQKEALDTK